MQIPYEKIPADTLRNLIEEFVSRDGTDYGEREVSLEQRVAQVMLALKQGHAVIEYDEQLEMADIRLLNAR